MFTDPRQITKYPSSEYDFPGTRAMQFGFDYQGHTWLGMNSDKHTNEPRGLGRYDGEHWWHYTTVNSSLLSNYVAGIAASPSTIWIATDGGLLAIDANASPDALLSIPDPHLPSTGAIKPDIYPNPVDRAATVRMHLDDRTMVDIELRDALGRRITTLASGIHEAGELNYTLDTDRLPPGVYYLWTNIGGQTSTQSLIVVH
jgi:hypothetical protein